MFRTSSFTWRPALFPHGIASAFDNGVVLNHPISLDVSTMDMDVFLAGFTCQGFDNKRQKEFENFSPKYNKAQHLYDYETVLCHCQGYNIFVPPLHTLVQAHDLGFWYERLPALIQSECIGYILPLLACCLSNPKTSFVTDPGSEHICNPDGYTMLANACCAAGHLRLAQNTLSSLAVPCQCSDQSLADYVSAWRLFLLQNILMGCFYSDRFFVKTLLYSMHIGFGGILESGITTRVQARDLNEPLPRALTPGQILQTMVDIGNKHHMSTLTTMSSRDLSACCVTQVVHQVAGSDTRDSDTSSAGDDAPSDLQFLTRALQGCLCYHCKSPDHIIRACPTASDEDKKHFSKTTRSLRSRPKA
jgi:hypothetical protein